MSLLKHGAPVASHVPQSLPSFAQTFNNSSTITSETASMSPPMGAGGQGQHISLPPIQQDRPSDSGQTKSPPLPLPPPSPTKQQHQDDSSRVAGRKRARTEAMSSTDQRSPSRSNSPTPIKEESQADMHIDHSPSHSNTLPPLPLKKRRVTVSGPALNTDVPRVGAGNDSNNTPISPVVLGLNVQRDDPGAVEAMRSMMSVKQKQQALIEQRRASVSAAHFPLDDRRHGGHSATATRHPSPTHPSQSSTLPPPANTPSLPPPSISFARRRADQLAQSGKRKPADILISPREAHTPEQLALSIQSAPPIPRPGAGGNPGRFPMMTLPRLPPVLKETEQSRRPIAGKVPPTPTRLAAAGAAPARPIPSISLHHAPGRSPKSASIPIASTLVPPTPSSLQHPGYSGDKAGFLAPFEMFYDALNDSKQLKGWLGEQLQRSNALLQQQERMAEYVDSLVEKRMSGVRAEIAGLHKRIEELETQQVGYRRSSIVGGSSSSSGKQPQRNNGNLGPLPGESYQFPPLPSSSGPRHSPMWERENPMERHGAVSSSRLDPPKPRGSATHSPPMYLGERERGRASTSSRQQHASPRLREGGDTAMAPPSSSNS